MNDKPNMIVEPDEPITAEQWKALALSSTIAALNFSNQAKAAIEHLQMELQKVRARLQP